MKKRLYRALVSVLLVVAMAIGVVACNLIDKDNSAYYNEVVITVNYNNTNKEFTQKDLIESFNTYGYQYYQNGSTLEESVTSSAEIMVERYLLVEEIKKLNVIDISSYANEIRSSVYEQMNKALKEIQTEIEEKRDLTVTNPEADEKKAIRDAKVDYEPSIIMEDGKLVRVELNTKNSNIVVPAKFQDTVYYKSAMAEAVNKYILSLTNNAKTYGNTDLSKEAVLKFEQDRLYKIYEQNKFVSLYQSYYENKLPINTDEIVAYFKENYNAQKSSYVSNSAKYNELMKNQTTSYVFYHDTSSEGYVYVNHILAKFDDNSQMKEIERIKLRAFGDSANGVPADNYYFENSYQNDLDAVIKNTVVEYETEDGTIETKNAYDIFNEVKLAVNKEITAEDKIKTFEDYVYKYNEDTGNMNKDFNYCVNIDSDVENIMVEEFTNASRELFNDYNDGDIYPEIVVTEYGFHIIIKTGAAKNITNDINSLTWEDLWNTKVNPASDKNLFQYFYETLKIDDGKYNTRVENMIADAKNVAQVKYYEWKYKNLWNE